MKHKVNWIKEYRRKYQLQKEGYLEKLHDFEEQIKDYKNYLEPGQYYLTSTPRLMLYKDTQESRLFIKSLSKHIQFKQPRKKEGTFYYRVYRFFVTCVVRVIDHFITRELFIMVHNDTPDVFQGSFVMSLHGHPNRFKLFDFKAYQSLTVGQDFVDLMKLKEYHTLFADYFDSPIMNIDEERQIILEEMVTTLPYSEWTYQDADAVIKEILTRYTHYVLSIKERYLKFISVKELTLKHPRLASSTEHQSLLDTYLKPYLNDKETLIPAHGDLYFFNILKSKVSGRNHVIDFEHARPLPFYYDGVWLILSAVYNSNDATYLNHFLEGYYDVYFDKLFKAVKQTFVNEKKRKYLFISLYIVQFYLHHELIPEMTEDQFKNHLQSRRDMFEQLESFIKSSKTL